MTTDEIRLVIPAEEDFRPIAHLVTGGLAMRLDVTYADLEDLQVGIEALLALRAPETVHEEDADGGLDLRRVLETVCDTHEIEERADGAWVELTKRVASVGASG